MGLDLQKNDFEWYVLAYMGNRDAFERGKIDDPAMVEIRVPTFKETRDATRLADQRTGLLSDEQNADIFARHVRRVKGITLGGKAITTGKELIAHADQIDADVIREINGAVNSFAVLSDGSKKNCESRRSSIVSKSEIDGTAEGAEHSG